MFEIVCEVANISGKTLTIETSIPEAEKPDVQILKSGQQLGVFASPTRSTVKITVVSVEDAGRIEKLEAALKHCINAIRQYEMGDDRPRGPAGPVRPWLLGAMDNAIQTLEGKDD